MFIKRNAFLVKTSDRYAVHFNCETIMSGYHNSFAVKVDLKTIQVTTVTENLTKEEQLIFETSVNSTLKRLIAR